MIVSEDPETRECHISGLKNSLVSQTQLQPHLIKSRDSEPPCRDSLPQGISHVPHVADLSKSRSPFWDILMTLTVQYVVFTCAKRVEANATTTWQTNRSSGIECETRIGRGFSNEERMKKSGRAKRATRAAALPYPVLQALQDSTALPVHAGRGPRSKV